MKIREITQEEREAITGPEFTPKVGDFWQEDINHVYKLLEAYNGLEIWRELEPVADVTKPRIEKRIDKLPQKVHNLENKLNDVSQLTKANRDKLISFEATLSNYKSFITFNVYDELKHRDIIIANNYNSLSNKVTELRGDFDSALSCQYDCLNSKLDNLIKKLARIGLKIED
jgi:hypothetical protein